MLSRGDAAAAQDRYHEALAFFRAALDEYRSQRRHDAGLLERIVFELIDLEVVLRSSSVGGASRFAPELREKLSEIDSARKIPGARRMRIASSAAWSYAFDGDRESAYRYARIADTLAPDAAWRVHALATRAQITALFGDEAAARQFAMTGLELAEGGDWNGTGEKRIGLLFLAEALALTYPLAAAGILARYDVLRTAHGRPAARGHVRVRIVETHVRGLVHRIHGARDEAFAAFEATRAAAAGAGILWREAVALIELDATAAAGHRGAYLERAARIVREHFPCSFLASRLKAWTHVYADPTVLALPPAQRRILRHLLDGKTQKEVAATTGLAVGTVGQYVKALLKAFGVRSTLELVVACYQSSVGAPSWAPDEPPRARAFTRDRPSRLE